MKDLIIEEGPLQGTVEDLFLPFSQDSGSFFLDSSLQGERYGRYSFFGVDPFLVFKSKGDDISIIEKGRVRKMKGNPFKILKQLMGEYTLPNLPDYPPFLGGAVGYLGYDMLHFVENVPRMAKDDIGIPDSYLGFYDVVVAVDHLMGKLFIISSGLPEKKGPARDLRAKERLDDLKLKMKLRHITSVDNSLFMCDSLRSNFTPSEYKSSVMRAKQYISCGDIFQVNLSQRFVVDISGKYSPYSVYLRLRSVNPAPYAGFLNFGDVSVLSSSPERFLRISGNHVETRPIKGTRPRGKNREEDKVLARDLLQSEKDQAELVMIVDLERNDLGRVCSYGTVWVPEVCNLETYSTVFHLVGTVRGSLSPGVTHMDCLEACFPGGSITGAPKIRAMEIIDELEPTQRSVYTGCIGYLGFNKQTDLNIAIRIMILLNGKVYFQAGGGIVADSDPDAEYQETLDKAKALFESLGSDIIHGIKGYESRIMG